MSLPLIKYVLKAALRDKLIAALVTVMIVGASLSVFTGSAAVTEKDYFSLVFAGGSLRLVGCLGLVLFVVFFIRRSFDTRDIEYLLSRPLGRVKFLLSYAASFSLLAIFTGLVQGISLYIIAPHMFGSGHALWIASIVVENILMVNVALFFSMVISSAATASMAAFGFYILARMMGEVLGIIDQGDHLVHSFPILKNVMEVISVLMPRLDLLGQTSWLVYGAGDDIGFGFIFLQGAVFTVLIILASLIDLVRRQF